MFMERSESSESARSDAAGHPEHWFPVSAAYNLVTGQAATAAGAPANAALTDGRFVPEGQTGTRSLEH